MGHKVIMESAARCWLVQAIDDTLIPKDVTKRIGARAAHCRSITLAMDICCLFRLSDLPVEEENQTRDCSGRLDCAYMYRFIFVMDNSKLRA